MQYQLPHTAAVVILAELAAAVRQCDGMRATNQPTELRRKAKAAGPHICGAVANMIGAAGSYGGTEQLRLMDAAADAGFAPEFYAGTIRVGWGG